MRRRKETHAVEARARLAGKLIRTKTSSRRSSVRVAGCRGGSVASRQRRTGRTGDAIAGEFTRRPPPAKGSGGFGDCG
uniref:Uncharacterized protein n=1 Tax=Arundo donax TaxID=35708 RepID=A0A0A8YTY0_ARUDO